MDPDRIRIAYRLTFETPFHCGTGIRTGLIDRTVVRDGQGYLYIPGSTFKGVLREHCEHLARFFDQPDVFSPHDAAAALLRLGKRQPSMVTRIFGSQHLPGRLFFDDAHQSRKDKKQYSRAPGEEDEGKEESGQKNDDGKYKSLQVSLATQVRLNRPTRTAAHGALYTSEFGINDLVFDGVIQGWLTCRPIDAPALQETVPTYSLLLLLAGLRMVERLGGNKSTGKGRCACEITQMDLNGSVIEQQEWEAWLQQLDALAQYSTEK